MKKLALFGDGGHAKVIIDLVSQTGVYEIARIYADAVDEANFATSVTQFDGAVVAIGDNWRRHQVVSRISEISPHLPFISLIHPTAIIAQDVTIGAGTVIMAGAVINPGTSLGEHCIINTRATIDHDGRIASFASVAPGATLGGAVQIGAFSAIGLGATVIHLVEIGEHTIIGAGATVLHPIDSHVVAYGTPAKAQRSRVAGERYL